MKVINSQPISSFGGVNFVFKEFNSLNINNLITANLPALPNQSKYSWQDILYSFWSFIFCGGDCAEDLAINLKPTINANPFFKLPSPDRILERMKCISEPPKQFTTPRGNSTHTFSFNEQLNKLNVKVLKKAGLINNVVLDYDNTILLTNKADAAYTYKKKQGYCPGVAFIGNNVVFVENRNGNSDAQTLQQNTLKRMFELLKSEKLNVNVFRADSASYQFSTLHIISKNVKKFFIRARMNESLCEAINTIDKWEKVTLDDRFLFRGSVKFTPFKETAKRNKQEHLLKECRLVVTKEKRKDGQINLFTGEAYNYSAILTNDFELTDDEVVFYYNQRGTTEKEFDILKNDFAWDKMPFSKIEHNTVFLIITAICRNLYNYIIKKFSKKHQFLSPKFRLKKFIFRFICVPAKWIVNGRQKKLRVYGALAFKT